MAPSHRQNRNPAHILPDVLASGLKVWFVGTAAGPKSAAVGAYYAHGANRFWRTLHEAGYVSVTKAFQQGRPLTTYSLTPAGRKACRRRAPGG